MEKNIPSVKDRVVAFKSMKYINDGLYLWDIPIVIHSLATEAVAQKLMVDRCGSQNCSEVFYNSGELQAYNAVKGLTEKYGFDKLLKSRKKLLEFNSSQQETIGRGPLTCLKFDTKEDIYIFSSPSTFAAQYKRVFGLQKEPVDFFVRGQLCGFIEYLVGKKLFCVETKCIAVGDDKCEFIIKPLEKWDKKDKYYQKQKLDNLHLFEKIKKI